MINTKNNFNHKSHELNKGILSDFYSFFLTNSIYFSNKGEYEKLNYLISIYNCLLYILDSDFDFTIKTKVDYILGWPHENVERLPLLDFVFGKELKESLKINDDYFSFDQKRIYDLLKINKLNVIEAPTSFGKSFLIRKFVVNEPGDFLIIVPTNALINEYINELKNDIRKIDGKKELVTAYNDVLNLCDSRKSKIYVMTFEKAMLIKDSKIKKFNKIIVDEAHESIVSPFSNRTFVENNFLRRINDSEKTIFFSPFIKDSSEQTQFLKISYTNQSFYDLENIGTNNIELRNLLSSEKIIRINKEIFYDYVAKEKNLIFSSKSNISTVFDSFKSNVSIPSLNYKEDFYFKVLNEYIDDQLIPEQYLKYYDLKRALNDGFLLHHGDMNRTLRRMIENAFKESENFKYIVTSSTLGKGVNLKANNLFMYTFLTDGTGKSWISFKNIIGRVGRMNSPKESKFRFGKVFLIGNGNKKNKEKNIVELEKFVNSSLEKKDEKIKKEVEKKTKEKISRINKKLQKEGLEQNDKADFALMYKDYLFNPKSDDKYSNLKILLLRSKIDPENDFEKERIFYIKEDMLIPNIKVSDINFKINEKKEKLKNLLDNINSKSDELIDEMEEIYKFLSYWKEKYNSHLLNLFKYSLKSYIFNYSPKKILIDRNSIIQGNIDYSKDKFPNKTDDYHVNHAINDVLTSNEKKMIFLQPFFENMVAKLGIEKIFDPVNDLTDFEDIIYQQTSIDEKEILKKISMLLEPNRQEIINNHYQILDIIKKWEKSGDSEKQKYYRYVKASIINL
ncbi:hypothetical protein LD120_00352 [Mesoplasma sp. JKS002657]|nr:hypothetical protein [Mesoplasma sp. JKS002661]MCL8216095.1 hypothetical protein [Mesoplasma sp. JKS002657]